MILFFIPLISQSCIDIKETNDRNFNLDIVYDFELRSIESDFQVLLHEKIDKGEFTSYDYTPTSIIFEDGDTVQPRSYKRIKVNRIAGLFNKPWGFDPFFHNDRLIRVEMFTNHTDFTLDSLAYFFKSKYEIEPNIISSDSIEFIIDPEFELLLWSTGKHYHIEFKDIKNVSIRESKHSKDYKSILWNEWGDSWDGENSNNFKNKLVDRHLIN